MVLLEEALSLPATGREQDWDLKLADASRTEEFLSCLERHHLASDSRLALVALVLASLELLMDERGSHPGLEERVAQLFGQERSLYSDLARRWKGEVGDRFAISHLVRPAGPS